MKAASKIFRPFEIKGVGHRLVRYEPSASGRALGALAGPAGPEPARYRVETPGKPCGSCFRAADLSGASSDEEHKCESRSSRPEPYGRSAPLAGKINAPAIASASAECRNLISVAPCLTLPPLAFNSNVFGPGRVRLRSFDS